MLGLIEAIFLGVVQGLTKFLPVSSSGHLLLGQYFLGLDQERFRLSFDTAGHVGTVLAVVLFFGGICSRCCAPFSVPSAARIFPTPSSAWPT